MSYTTRNRSVDFIRGYKVYRLAGVDMHIASSLTIGKLAGRSGVSAQAIRYYERSGLLPARSLALARLAISEVIVWRRLDAKTVEYGVEDEITSVPRLIVMPVPA